MYLNIMLIITLLILLIPFTIYLKYTKKKEKITFFFAIIIYLIIASPVIYGVINHKIVQYEEANIGLGLSFFITWFLAICAFIFSLYLLIKARETN